MKRQKETKCPSRDRTTKIIVQGFVQVYVNYLFGFVSNQNLRVAAEPVLTLLCFGIFYCFLLILYKSRGFQLYHIDILICHQLLSYCYHSNSQGEYLTYYILSQGGNYIHSRGFSVYHIFRHITVTAAAADTIYFQFSYQYKAQIPQIVIWRSYASSI